MDVKSDVATAASQLTESVDEAIRFFQQLDIREGSVAKRLKQLSSLSTLVREVESNPSPNDDEIGEQLDFTKRTLLRCFEIISDVLTELNRITTDKLNLKEPEYWAVYHELCGKKLKDLLDNLNKERLCLTDFRKTK